MSIHKSVLPKETIELLNLKKGDVVVDATLGGAGHSREILKIIKNGKLIAIDADSEAIENFKKESGEGVILVNDNFANLEKILETLKIEKVGAILADLGWSSDQLEGRGMSFRKDEELDMRYSLRITESSTNYESVQIYECTKTAKEIVNNYSEEELAKIIKNYGEEKYAKSIARGIVKFRKRKPVKTTFDLVSIIKSSVPGEYRHSKINPATKTFQALRIAVNNELENLEKFIPQAIASLKQGGRLAIITFHSLEDRIVKNLFRENARGCILPDPITGRGIVKSAPTVKIVNKKPIIASDSEILDNPKARSAKLRVCEKL